MTDDEVKPVEKYSPEHWGKVKGYWLVSRHPASKGRGRWSTPFTVADHCYGWSQNRYHFSEDPFVLSESDFDKAMLKIKQYPTVKPHEAALTPYARSLRAKRAK